MVAIASKILSTCVLVPTYNRPAYLIEAIDGILSQTVPATRIIVTDDGSTPETSEALQVFGDRIEHDWAPNSGKAAALNRVMRSVSEDLVWIFDDDDIANPRALEWLRRPFEVDANVQFTYSPYDHLVKVDGHWVTKPVDLPVPPDANLKTAILEQCFAFQPGMLARRTLYDVVGPFNEKLARSQDYEMLLRLSRWAAGTRIDAITFHQRQHAGDRGPSFARAAAGRSEANWAAYDRHTFSHIYDDYALSEYLPGSEYHRDGAGLSPVEQAQALIHRICVMGRKGMWTQVAQDTRAFSAALTDKDIQAAVSLEPFSRVFGEKSNALSSVVDLPAFVTALGTLPGGIRRGTVGRMVRSLGSGIKWALASNRPKRAVELTPPLMKISSALLR